MRSNLIGQRLKAARLRVGIAQDKLGVAIGLEESSSSARMSRYECGIHEPPFSVVEKLAKTLKVPTAYFFCDDDTLASIMLIYAAMPESKRKDMLGYLQEKLDENKNND